MTGCSPAAASSASRSALLGADPLVGGRRDLRRVGHLAAQRARPARVESATFCSWTRIRSAEIGAVATAQVAAAGGTGAGGEEHAGAGEGDGYGQPPDASHAWSSSEPSRPGTESGPGQCAASAPRTRRARWGRYDYANRRGTAREVARQQPGRSTPGPPQTRLAEEHDLECPSPAFAAAAPSPRRPRAPRPCASAARGGWCPLMVGCFVLGLALGGRLLHHPDGVPDRRASGRGTWGSASG